MCDCVSVLLLMLLLLLQQTTISARGAQAIRTNVCMTMFLIRLHALNMTETLH